MAHQDSGAGSRTRAVWRVFATLPLLLLSACSAGNRGGINISGSTSVSPFVEHLAEVYERDHKGGVINVQSLGSTAGIQAAIQGVAEVGMSSRTLKPEESEKLDELVIARDALAIVTHPSNPVRGLSIKQVQEIFGGSITDWSQLGGRPAKITLIVREAGSGTFGAFEELVMKGKPVTPAALRQGSNGAIRQAVAEDANAIGYISLGIVDASVNALTIDGVVPSVEQVLAKKYKFVRPFLFVWPKGKTLDAASREFIDFVMSDFAQEDLRKLGLVPAKVGSQGMNAVPQSAVRVNDPA
jgi:phosphate transport system substrate-binding protein